jgi:hypothetical protein
MLRLEIFATDKYGRQPITDLYWFEENGVHSLEEAEGHYGEKYGFEIFVDGIKVWTNV